MDALEFKNITKKFGLFAANQDISFSVAPRTIHGIVGENGAGKSTLMNILYGLFPPDTGEICLGGKPTHFKSPEDAISHGVGMVHQHFMLVPTLTVWENIILGREPHALLKKKYIYPQLNDLIRTYGITLDLRKKIEDLSVGEQQQVEILKVLYRGANLIILDEPTAVLTPPEIESLFERLKEFSRTKTILLITHKLKEIFALTQKVTVLRQGQCVGTYETQTLTSESLAEKMIGRPQKRVANTSHRKERPKNFEISSLSLEKDKKEVLSNINFQIEESEIFGICGVTGNGQEELVRVLLGLEKHMTGKILLGNRNFFEVPKKELSLIPSDRHREGLILNMSVRENLLLGREDEFSNLFQFEESKIVEFEQRAYDAFDIRPKNPKLSVKSLSGGNQQKVIFARELSPHTRFVLASFPTRGVDIGASEIIHQRLLTYREKGLPILLISSELEELMALCDRISVIFRGRLVGELGKENFDLQTLGLLMTKGEVA